MVFGNWYSSTIIRSFTTKLISSSFSVARNKTLIPALFVSIIILTARILVYTFWNKDNEKKPASLMPKRSPVISSYPLENCPPASPAADQVMSPVLTPIPMHSLPLIFATHKRLIKQLLCAYDGLHGAITPAFRAHGFHGWDSQRSVMNIHVWSAARKILGEIERGRKMNIELTCWAG